MARDFSISKTVLVAMSGGVDSGVAALLLRDAGYEVTGAFICMERYGYAERERRCCSVDDAADVRAVAAQLGIRVMTVRAGASFDRIVSRFVDSYKSGRTPNPCIECNTDLKFGRLFEIADSIGARYVATGHYARLVCHGNVKAIARARACGKDQSYVLFGIHPDRLERVLLPLGELPSKAEVRRLAAEAGLRIHNKPDSQEICFVPGEGLAAMLKERCPEAMQPGPILDMEGHVLGQHDGAAQYTIGQRRGLGIGGGQPLYVSRVDPSESAVWVGPRQALASVGLIASGANWFGDVPERFSADVQIRYHHRAVPAEINRLPEARFVVRFAQPVEAVTPGQAAVVYGDDVVFGGGWIESSLSAEDFLKEAEVA